VIDATTLFQAQVAGRQRSGTVSRELQPLKERLIGIVVSLESAVEFVEENLPVDSRDNIAASLELVRTGIQGWVDSFRRGRIIRDGFGMAIVGRPNVGKSSLFNSLLSQDRSIVTEVPGTTRDLVSEFTSLDGIPVRLVDTAGVRPTPDMVEQLGVNRSYQAMVDADTVLLVVDTSTAITREDIELRDHLRGARCLVVMNKSDLDCVWTSDDKKNFAAAYPSLEVSAKTGSGIGDLKEVILRRLFGDDAAKQDGMLITNLRQCRCLQDALASLARAQKALSEGMSEEFVLVDLHAALRGLGAVTGETSAEDILGEIFSRFCIGK